jgi:diguanylate cyclase (GGDEF)-like protein
MPPVPEEHDLALDALAALVRAFGRHAFDVAEVPARDLAARAEAWAQHLLLRRPPPGVTEDDEDRRPWRRDFGAVLEFFTGHRRREVSWVQSAIGDLRSVVWSVIERVNGSVPEEAREAADARAQITRLRTAVERGSIAELRAEALRVAGTLGELLDRRAARQKEDLQALGQHVRSLGERLEQARREGAVDPLTGLFNRRELDAQLARAQELTSLLGQPSCLILVDLDHFKQVNDQHGHPAGDEVLRKVADCLARSFPRRGDCIARFGGEELAVILRDAGRNDAARLADRFLKALRKLDIPWLDDVIRVTASAGIAESLAGEKAAAWLARADRALYAAKEGGRDRLVVV